MLRYDSRDMKYKKPFGAVAAGTAIAFHVDVDQTSSLPTCYMAVRMESCRGEVADQQWDIKGVSVTDGWDFLFTPQTEGLYFYKFTVPGSNGAAEETREYQLTVYRRGFETPKWLKCGLMYQIFPDRFCRSAEYQAPQISNKAYRIHQQWGELPDRGPDERGIVWNNDFFGGNLRGIRENLSYLRDLGVTVLYLNPIFEAFSNHRYDTANYRNIDPLLGTEEDLRELCSQAKEMGMRVILDGVFNHTGSHSIYFNKDGAYDTVGACQGESSPYYKWYRFSHFPDRYDCWWGIDTLPAVNEEDSGYLDYIVRDEDSVIRHWLSCGVSGYRLDVADELPDMFLDILRRCVKEEKADACVIGEVWEDASNKIAYGLRRRYLQGEQLDSAMNYPLKDELLSFLLKHGDGVRFMDRICGLWENYPPQVFYALMNLLGTHDTVRIYTVMLQGSGGDRDLARQRLFLALMVWAFMPGIPSLYYGDELGMEGERDPMNRQCFPAKPKDLQVAQFYRRLLNFRRRVMWNKYGDEPMEFRPGVCGKGYVSFFREGEKSRIYVVINQTGEPMNVEFPVQEGERPLDFVNCGFLRLFTNFHGCQLGEYSGIAVEIEKSGE